MPYGISVKGNKMKIKFAHLRDKSTNGGYIDFVVFNGKPSGNMNIALRQLTEQVRQSGLKVDKSAFQYLENRNVVYYGDDDLTKYLQNRGPITSWTHEI